MAETLPIRRKTLSNQSIYPCSFSQQFSRLLYDISYVFLITFSKRTLRKICKKVKIYNSTCKLYKRKTVYSKITGFKVELTLVSDHQKVEGIVYLS